MNQLLLHCRPGFEKECAAEIQDQASNYEVYGFPQLEKESGFVRFQCYQEGDAIKLMEELPFDTLIFARSWFVVLAELKDMMTEDRISAVLAESWALPKCGQLWVESGDGEGYRSLLSFCRKFTVPLRQALRHSGSLTKKENLKMPRVHLFLTDSQNGYLGYSRSDNGAQEYMGISRLKFPSAAPSRSTLKLEEAIKQFMTPEQEIERMHGGLQAVDLGACPGGWTYQLVQRGMFVQSVDNGAMADSLMESGQVTHHMVDGFKFEPESRNNRWLVCDMIEKPDRVANLMAEWFINGWCNEAIFNLKLPMKQRYVGVTECLGLLRKKLFNNGIRFEYKVKHLFHDREEVTVYLRRIK